MAWWQIYLMGGAAILALMTVLWLISLARRDASIVDAFWGPGFGVAALAYFAITHGWLARQLLVTALVLIWGVRLGVHIFRRNHGKGEDYRYAAWRAQYGPNYWWISFFQVFVLQGVLMWLISAPVLAAMIHAEPNTFTALDALGLAVWLIGFSFETVGDWQLARFKANPANRGKVMMTGLWRYTRHPNYFGDACVWWGIWLIAGSVPLGWITLFAPLLMTFLLVRVSGVSLLEQRMMQRPEYRAYAERTSAFFPLSPKRDR